MLHPSKQQTTISTILRPAWVNSLFRSNKRYYSMECLQLPTLFAYSVIYFNVWPCKERVMGSSMKIIRSTEQVKRLPEATILSQQFPITASDSDEWILATHGRTFHFASRFLSPKLRHDVATLYAFFRTVDDLVDIPSADRRTEDIRIELDAWQSWFQENRSFPAPREPLGSRLAAVLSEHCIPTAIDITCTLRLCP